mgnify:CR=1 FL=1
MSIFHTTQSKGKSALSLTIRRRWCLEGLHDVIDQQPSEQYNNFYFIDEFDEKLKKKLTISQLQNVGCQITLGC